jgi:predicted 3-demethylubiquinone-9 3-methyltransferase (glyoxalase superfamily)
MKRGGNININKETSMQQITTFLWFNGQAEEAANFYVSLFKNSRIVTVARYGEAGPGPGCGDPMSRREGV